MSRYNPVFCAACRTMVLVDSVASTEQIRPWRWVGNGTLHGIMFCSDECEEKGAPAPTRKPVQAFVDLDRNATPEFRQGFGDALAGYDCIGSRPSYVSGHGAGMRFRDLTAEFRGEGNAITRKTD